MSTALKDIDRSGFFRGEIIEFGLKEEPSGAVAVGIEARIDEMWNDETKEWEDWRAYQMRAFGYVYIVKKDGNLNEKQVQSLCQFAGWDGNLDSISNNTWHPTPCRFDVGLDEYQGNSRFRINWLNEYDRAPGGGLGQVSDERLRALNQRFGGSLRAIASKAKSTPIPAPNGKPQAPPPPTRETVAAAASEDETPF